MRPIPLPIVALALWAGIASCARSQDPLQGLGWKELKPLRFERPSALTTREAMRERIPTLVPTEGPERLVNLPKEGFHVYEPRERARWRGLLVWISPVDAAWLDPTWAPILRRRSILFVTPDRAGNERPIAERCALALEAAHGAFEKYRIDRRHVFVAGFSGGGRMASLLGTHWSDVFTGTYCMGGTNWFENAPLASAGKVFEARLPRPPKNVLERIVRRPFVWMAGGECFNREETRAIWKRAGVDGFRHTLHQEPEGIGHRPARDGTFQKGLDFLLRHAR